MVARCRQLQQQRKEVLEMTVAASQARPAKPLAKSAMKKAATPTLSEALKQRRAKWVQEPPALLVAGRFL